MTLNFVRDFSQPEDYFLCKYDEIEGAKPICSYELYIQTKHIPLPFYNIERWKRIEEALGWIANVGEALTFFDFKTKFLSYLNFSAEPDLSVIASLFNQDSTAYFNKRILSSIARLALELPKQIKQPIRALRREENGSLTLSQLQIASLLANAFYSTFTARNFGEFNRINFIRLFTRKTPKAAEKLKCILHYFYQFFKNPPNGTVSIIRQKLNCELEPKWDEIELNLVNLNALPNGRIENEGEKMTQVDFANEFIGGGVLGYGLVQEEIRFLICPELIISCFVCEKMEKNEAILIIGAERYSDYQGYGSTFCWKYRQRDVSLQRDAMGRVMSELLAIDALNFSHPLEQFFEGYIRRELRKAFIGFAIRTAWSFDQIATGNWGCGVFGGDLHLKSLIQLMAASLACRPLVFFTFGKKLFAQELEETVKLLQAEGFTIGKLYRLIIKYCKFGIARPKSLFGWIKENYKDFV
uniref:poly(ADP-ribose) glycohydrolase n=1 Tax=Meloidogyne incognita TaxID=6306 RepID=A0A914LEV2_MELIC